MGEDNQSYSFLESWHYYVYQMRIVTKKLFIIRSISQHEGQRSRRITMPTCICTYMFIIGIHNPTTNLVAQLRNSNQHLIKSLLLLRLYPKKLTCCSNDRWLQFFIFYFCFFHSAAGEPGDQFMFLLRSPHLKCQSRLR